MIKGTLGLLVMIVLHNIDPVLNTIVAVGCGIWLVFLFGAHLVDWYGPENPAVTPPTPSQHPAYRQILKDD